MNTAGRAYLMSAAYLEFSGKSITSMQMASAFTDSDRNKLFLTRLLFWLQHATINRHGLLWVAKSHEQWAEESTLSTNQIKKTVADLKASRVIQTRQGLFHGKNISHIALTEEALAVALLLQSQASLFGGWASYSRGAKHHVRDRVQEALRRPQNAASILTSPFPPVTAETGPVDEPMDPVDKPAPTYQLSEPNEAKIVYGSVVAKNPDVTVWNTAMTGQWTSGTIAHPEDEPVVPYGTTQVVPPDTTQVVPLGTTHIQEDLQEDVMKTFAPSAGEQTMPTVSEIMASKTYEKMPKGKGKGFMASMGELWRGLHKDVFEIPLPKLTGKQLGQLKMFVEKVEAVMPGHMTEGQKSQLWPDLLRHLFEHWLEFRELVEKSTGTKTSPALPNLGYVLKHAEFVMELWGKPHEKPTKHDMQIIAPEPQPVPDKPQPVQAPSTKSVKEQMQELAKLKKGV